MAGKTMYVCRTSWRRRVSAGAVRRGRRAYRQPHRRPAHDPYGPCRLEFVNNLPEPDNFVHGVHVTGDLDNLEQGTPNDKRHFATIADERLIFHYGSSYGGNALLGKIAHGFARPRTTAGPPVDSSSEQFMLIGILDKVDGAQCTTSVAVSPAPPARPTSR